MDSHSKDESINYQAVLNIGHMYSRIFHLNVEMGMSSQVGVQFSNQIIS